MPLAMVERVGMTTGAVPTWRSSPPRSSRAAWHFLQTTLTVASWSRVRTVPQDGQVAWEGLMGLLPGLEHGRLGLGGRFLDNGAAGQTADRHALGPKQPGQLSLPVPARAGTAARQAEDGDAM